MADTVLATTGTLERDSGTQTVKLGKFESSGGNWYFVITSSETDTGSATIYINKSTDRGATWTEIATRNAAAMSVTSIADSSVAFANDIIYIAAAVDASGNAFRIARFDTSTDTFSSDLNPGVSPRLVTNFSLAVKSTGKIGLAYASTAEVISSTSYNRISYIEYNGVWGSVELLPSQSGVTKNFTMGYLMVSSSDRLHFFYSSQSAGDLLHVTRTDDGTYHTVQTIASGVIYGFPTFPMIGVGAAYTDAGSVARIAIPYVNGTGADWIIEAATAADADNPTWTVSLIEDLPAGVGAPTASTHDTTISLAYDSAVASIGLHYYYQVTPTFTGSFKPATSEIRRATFDGSSWSAPVLFRSYADPTAGVGVLANSGTSAFILLMNNSTYSTGAGSRAAFTHIFASDAVATASKSFICGKGGIVSKASSIS
jgi:hypothetical protein